ncbi:taste receptor type 2 member 143-like [Protopterus annectens]|uniref:taste receptor type 2 member 143-like n=1 Tax=Protopterus annectens TaxID=7888 RepID=UPI001CFBE190|nr:taste receptor type 2 member 143-like [Protopterus annectens]
MHSSGDILVLFLSTLVSVFGLLEHSFIITVYIRDLKNNGKLDSQDLIITSLAVSNILAQVIQFIVITISALHTWHPGYQYFYFFHLFSCSLSSWLLAWLCIFYCVKIINSSHNCFLWIKKKTVCMTPHILLGIVVCSTIISGTASFVTESTTLVNVTGTTGNYTLKYICSACTTGHYLYLACASFLPFIILVTSSIVIIIYLCQHAQKMETILQGSGSLGAEIHIRVIKMFFSIIFIYTLIFSAVISYALFAEYIKDVSSIILAMLYVTFPFNSSCLIIYSNTKLRSRCVSIWYCRNSHEDG